MMVVSRGMFVRCMVALWCYAWAANLVTRAAFLEETLPLTIDATIPSQLLRERNRNPIEFSESESITVVFSRAVIALGADFGEEEIPEAFVPFRFTDSELIVGRGRWVTTSIFRWDPSTRWSTDVSAQLIWNAELTTYDGVQIDLTNISRRVDIETPSLRGTLAGVGSMEALRLTDDHWDGQLGLEDDNLPEVPPDGALVLQFSRIVLLPSLEENLQVVRFGEDGTSRERFERAIRVRTCVELEEELVNENGQPILDDCAIVDFGDGIDIERDRMHGLVIPRGWEYRPDVHGPLRREILIEFYGLRRFRLPFLTSFSQPGSISDVNEQFDSGAINGVNLTIWLPHGLADGVTTADLKSAIILQQLPWDRPGTWIELDYELVQADRGTLFLTADFEHSQRYKLLVLGRDAIRDGYGLPLEAGEVQFSTSRVRPHTLLLIPSQDPILQQRGIAIDGSDTEWNGEIFHFVRRPDVRENAIIRAWSLLPENDEELTRTGLLLNRYPLNRNSLDLTLGKDPILEAELSPQTVNEVSVTPISFRESLEEARGSVLVESLGVGADFIGYYNMRDVDFHFFTIGFPRRDRNGRFSFDVVILLTSARTGDVIPDAKITAMRRVDVPFAELDAEDEINLEIVDRLKTNKEGIVMYRPPPCNATSRCDLMTYFIETDTRSVFVQHDIPYYTVEGFGYDSEATLIFDRRLVEPGDTLHLGGFLVSREDSLEVRPFGQNPNDGARSVTISPTFDPNAEPFETMEFPVEINSDYGTFQLEIDVPANAPRGEYFVQSPFFEFFTVGEPRVLTAQLTLVTPPWVRPNGTFEVDVTIASLLGIPIADAEFSLRWGSVREGNQGSADLMTNATGQASYTIDLSEADEAIEAGDDIEIEVQYIGPTREPIFEQASVAVAFTPLWLIVDESITNIVPTLTEFGVYVCVNSREDRDDVYDIEVELLDVEDSLNAADFNERFARLKWKQDEGIVLDIEDSCLLRSNQTRFEMYRTCRFTLPDIGHYFLRACVDIGDDFACEVSELGKNITEWENDPLQCHPEPSIDDFEQTIRVNGEVQYFVDLPFEDTRALVMWGNDLESAHQMFQFGRPGLYPFTLRTGEECLGGCFARMLFASPRQDIKLDIDIPTAFDFDLQLPVSFERRIEIDIEDAEIPFTLEVDMEIERTIVRPGSNTTIDITVQKCAGDPNLVDPATCAELVPARDVEILMVGVDKAYLLLEENLLVNLVDALELEWRTNAFSLTPIREWRSNNFSAKVLELLLEIEALDPWQLTNILTSFGDGLQNFVFEFPIFLDAYRQSHAVTIAPPGLSRILAWFGRELQQAPDPPSMPSGRSPDSVQEGEDPDLRLEAEFEVTPLFTVVKTDSEGRASVNFTAPDNVGTFVLQAYASSLDAQHGSTELEIINRLPLTLTPSAPRFVRVGDAFEAGVIVTIAMEEREGIPVRVTLLGDPAEDSSIVYRSEMETIEATVDEECDADEELNCLVVLDSQEFTSDVDGQVEVRFEFDAIRLGNANITISADAAGESDALRLSIPVFGQQESVSLATSFSLNPEEMVEEAAEGLDLPEAVPGSGTLDLLAGVGKFPAVLEIAERFMTDEAGLSAPAALANISLAFIFQGYDVDRSAENRALYRRALTAFDMGIANVNEGNLTSQERGLQWFPSRGFVFFNRVDVTLNAYALRLANVFLDALRTENRIVRRGVNRLESLSKTWRNRMIEQYIEDAEEIERSGSEPSRYTVLRVLQAMGADWEVPICPSEETCTREEVAELLTLNKMLDDFNEDRMSLDEQVILALLLLENEGRQANERPEVQSILDRLFNSIRTTGRTSYIAISPESSTPAGSLTQVEALRVFVLSGRALGDPLIARLSNNVASGDFGSFVFFFRSSVVDTMIMFALLEYDQLTGSSDPDLSIEVQSGNSTLLEGEFTSPSDPVIESTTALDDLDDPPSPLVFTSEGTGEVSLVASLDFIPAELLPFPTYRGLFVERIVRESDENGDPIGPPLKTIPLASTAVVTLQITTPDRLDEVTVRALMPGGLEPIDPLVTESETVASTCVLDDLDIQFFLWFWPLCPRQETRPSEVTFTYSRLRAGTHGIQFRAVAASVGNWILPPVQAYVTSQPEVMGLSVAGEFVVCDGPACEAEPVEEDRDLPQDCPGDCNGTGICDLTTGKCQCDRGYTGEDCGTIEET